MAYYNLDERKAVGVIDNRTMNSYTMRDQDFDDPLGCFDWEAAHDPDQALEDCENDLNCTPCMQALFM